LRTAQDRAFYKGGGEVEVGFEGEEVEHGGWLRVTYVSWLSGTVCLVGRERNEAVLA
jgi:hypothetical protein